MVNPDVWMQKNAKPDGTACWEHVLCCVDDVLAVLHDPKAVMDSLSNHCTLKPGSVQEPTEHLGTQICHCEFADGEETWSVSSDPHAKHAVADVEMELKKINQSLRTKA